MAARVMVFAKINREDAEAFEAAYAQVTANVKGTAGHLGDELLRRREPPDSDGEPHPYWAGTNERIIYDVAHTIKPTA